MNFQKTSNRWQLIVARRNCMLRINLVLNGASHSLKNEIDFDNNHVLALSYNGERGVYNDEESLRKMGMAIVKAIKENPDFIENNVKRCIEVSENLVKVAKESSQRQDLIQAFKEYVEKHHEFSAFMFFPIGIEKIITKQVREEVRKLVSESEFQNTLNKLTTPSKILDSTQEQIDLMKIALEKDFDQLEEHQKKYGFLNVYNQDEHPDSLDSYKTRLHALLQTDVKKKLKDFQEEFEKREKEFEETVNELNISGHLLDIVKILREYVYLRSFRLEMLNKSNLLIQPLLKKLGESFGLTLSEVCALTAEEIISNELPPKEEIKSRIEGYVYLQQGRKYQIFTEDLDQIKKLEFGEEKDYSKVREIRGDTACQGKVRGSVRVLKSKEEIHLLKEGEILVTSMTTPDYVMAMEKSRAIVTNEGGMLCHAAIVSREMKIPCVVGTEIATKVLQTGDVIEVDATEGRIVVLEKINP
jgi:phosphohistidine swiveling domain-containing protein